MAVQRLAHALVMSNLDVTANRRTHVGTNNAARDSSKVSDERAESIDHGTIPAVL